MAEPTSSDGLSARRPASMRKMLTEVLRRGWIVLLSVVMVGFVAWGAATAMSRSYSAEAVTVVRAGGPLAAQPDASTKLAATYATLIPLDSSVQDAVERVLPNRQNSSFTASNDANTALLRIIYTAPESRLAIGGALAVVHAIAGGKPASTSISPNSIEIVRLPLTATGSGSTPQELIPIGAIIGLLLGFVLVAFWRSRDARIDNLSELRGELGCPCFDVGVRRTAGLPALVQALGLSSDRTIAVLPCTARDRDAAAKLLDALSVALPGDRFLTAAPAGSEQAGELVAATADATLLVIRPGGRVVALSEAVDILERYESAPAYAALAGRNVTNLPAQLANGDEAHVLSGSPAG